MAKNHRYIEPVTDDDGFIVDGGYSAWDCEAHLMPENPSVYDDEIGDLEGYEIQHAGD